MNLPIFKTGDKVPENGFYRYVRYSDDTIEEKSAKRVISLKKGDVFPPYQRAKQLAYWTLELYA